MKDIIIFGASEGGKNYLSKQKEYNVVKILDNDRAKWGKKLEGIVIESPEVLLDFHQYHQIVITSMYYDEIENQLVNEFFVEKEKVLPPPKRYLKVAYEPFMDMKTLKVAKETLSDIVEVSRDNGIICYLDFGTLLGYVRDRDLIPWDDDIDLSVRENDFPKFIEVMREYTCNKKELWESYISRDKDGSILSMSLTLKETNLNLRYFSINISCLMFSEGFAIQSYNKVKDQYFLDYQSLDVDGNTFYVPFNYKSYLAETYGDWKTPQKNITYELYKRQFSTESRQWLR